MSTKDLKTEGQRDRGERDWIILRFADGEARKMSQLVLDYRVVARPECMHSVNADAPALRANFKDPQVINRRIWYKGRCMKDWRVPQPNLSPLCIMINRKVPDGEEA